MTSLMLSIRAENIPIMLNVPANDMSMMSLMLSILAQTKPVGKHPARITPVMFSISAENIPTIPRIPSIFAQNIPLTTF